MAETVLVVVLLVVLAYFGMRKVTRSARQMSTLVSRGVTVTGTVTKAEHVRKSRAAQRVSELGYTFRTTGGIEYTRTIRVLPKEIQKFSVGQSIEIVYDPSDPNVNMIKEQVDIARQAMAKAQAKS